MSETPKQLIERIDKTRETLNVKTENLKKEISTKFDSLVNQLIAKVDPTKIDGLIEDFNNSINQSMISHSKTQNGLLEGLEVEIKKHFTESREQLENHFLDVSTEVANGLNSSKAEINVLTSDFSKAVEKSSKKVEDLADQSINEPTEILKERDGKMLEELKEVLKIQQDELSAAILNLKNQFSEDISTKVETVYAGVNKTKDLVNGTITDTISSIRQNLIRLNEEIDTHFTAEVGDLQNVIHNYEGLMLGVIEKTITNYESQVAQIINKYSDTTNSSISEILQGLKDVNERLKAEVSSNKDANLKEAIRINETTMRTVDTALTDFAKSIDELRIHLTTFKEANLSSVSNAIKQQREETKREIDSTVSRLDALTKNSLDEISKKVDAMKNDANTHRKEASKEIDVITKSMKDELKMLSKDIKKAQKEVS